ncbi:MAG: ATP-binding cassette domain-containing protein, partial [Bacilli bacterium]|nr:ATP-binding cassette domain-containing protein [Bacilli bacterium]
IFRDRIIKKLDKLPLSYFDRVPYGDTLSVGTNDVDNISRNLQSIVTQISSGIALFFATTIGMFVYEWRLALIALAVLPITLIAVMQISKASQKQFKIYRKELGILNGKIEENYAGFEVIKLFNKQQDIEEEFDEVNIKMAKSDRISQFLSGLIWPVTIFINNIAYVGIAVVGGVIGELGTMITFFTLLNLFTRPFQQVGQIVNVIQSVLAAGERVYSLLDEQEETPDKETAIEDEEQIKGEFYFDDVYFSYIKNKPLIENFTLHVNAGDTIAIVGPTGAGKTTMVNLIMRFYDITNIANDQDLIQKGQNEIKEINQFYEVDGKFEYNFDGLEEIRDKTAQVRNFVLSYLADARSRSNKKFSEEEAKIDEIYDQIILNVFNNGNIKLDNKTIFNYTRKCLRGSIGMVLQDTWLFKGTIKENLLYGDQNATDEEIENACRQAHAWHFIQALPGGLDFVLNEDGDNISQGQRQLLTIARAIISKPKIMILDEATSSVDTRTEQRIQDALDKIMVGRTSFVIAHRLSTIKNAKLIIVMKKGHIIETGNHKELLAKNGFYADLYNSQFSGVNPMQKKEVLES